MIALIGPADSVEMIRNLSVPLGLQAYILPAIYDDPAEAAEIAARMERICTITLFTGRLPYLISNARRRGGGETLYIAHDENDLFRTLAKLSLSPAYRGRIPRISLDSIAISDASEAYRELNIEPNFRLIGLDDYIHDAEFDINRLIAAHTGLYRRGEVELCVTAIDRVHSRLAEAGVETLRLMHSIASVRQALRRAKMILELKRLEGGQTVICAIHFDGRGSSEPVPSARRLGEIGRSLAAEVSGRVLSQEDGVVRILTNRHSIETHVSRNAHGGTGGSGGGQRPVIAIGIGDNAASAEELAGKALHGSYASDRFLTLDGIEFAVSLVDSEENSRIRRQNLVSHQTDRPYPHIIERIAAAFQKIDPNGFTASEFAAAYGVTPRSARRILALLRERGIIEESGIDVRRTVGRPQHVFRIFLQKLLENGIGS